MSLAVSGGMHGELRFHNLGSMNCVKTIDGSEYNHTLSHINAIVVKNKTLAVCGHSWIRLHALEKLENLATVLEDGHSANVTSLTFQADEKWLVSTGEDGKVRIWDFRARGYQLGICHSSPINCGTIHPNQGVLVFGDQEGCANHFDLAANRVLRYKVGDKTGLGVMTVSYDDHSRLVCTHDNNHVSVLLEPVDSNSAEEGLNNIDSDIKDNDDASPRHALMPPRMIPLISRSVSNTVPTKTCVPNIHSVTNLPSAPQKVHKFGTDLHSRGYITSLNLSGPEATRHQAALLTSSDGSFSVWRTSHDDSLYSLDSHVTFGNRVWCTDAKFVDDRTRFVVASYTDGKCRLWDTIRPSMTPVGAFDAGHGKSVKAICVLPGDSNESHDRRIR